MAESEHRKLKPGEERVEEVSSKEVGEACSREEGEASSKEVEKVSSEEEVGEASSKAEEEQKDASGAAYMDEAVLRHLAKCTRGYSDKELEDVLRSASKGCEQAEVERRLAIIRSYRSKQVKKPSLSFSTLLMIITISAAALMSMLGGSPTEGRMEVATLDQSLFQTVISPQPGFSLRGPNGPDTDWAVFFYKPYCGACRRVRPIFHALARTTNHTRQLRFGEIDCVKFRPLCHHAKAKEQPTIRIYAASNKTSQEKKFHRREVASWQGVLIAYEVLGWFAWLQHNGYISKHIEWASDETLAEEMRQFKLAGDHRVDRATSKSPSDPRAYLDSVDAAWRMGLHDAVFQRTDVLEQNRLLIMAEWLDALGNSLPRKAWREQADAIRTEIASRSSWSSYAFEKLLRKHHVYEPTHWKSDCGYTCSLWILFHTLLANSDRHAAPHVLRAINGWIDEFFGCTECASHFRDMWTDQNGGAADDAISANVWLWRAHNAVTSRLALAEKDEDETKRPMLWPTNESCKTCFKSYHKALLETENEQKKKKKKRRDDPIQEVNFSLPSDSLSTSSVDSDDDFDEGYVFQFLSETYCFNSDTFVCASFDDPSRAKKHREPLKSTKDNRNDKRHDEI